MMFEKCPNYPSLLVICITIAFYFNVGNGQKEVEEEIINETETKVALRLDRRLAIDLHDNDSSSPRYAKLG